MNHVDSPTSLCRLGIARADITPPVGIYHRMWGAATHDRATGVHRPLTATALVFHPWQEPIDPERKTVFVAIDHCLLWAPEMNDLLAQLPYRDRVVVCFSHTHASGLMDLTRTHMPGGEMIADYLKHLGTTLSKLIHQADSKLQAVTITYGHGRCDLAAQRDFWDEASGQYVCGFNPGGDADDTVLVGRVTDEAGNRVATLVNYACHPTTLAWENTRISPDYPGALRETVEQATGAPCVFFQGASGDLGPREGFVGDTTVADRNGRQLGYAVLATLEALPPRASRFTYQGPVISGATLGSWTYVHSPLEVREQQRSWAVRQFQIPLPYRSELPTHPQVETDLDAWQTKEKTAHERGDEAGFRDAHAMVERLRRMRTRLQHLPPGDRFPLPVTLLRVGSAVWVAVEGEMYQWFQRHLRERFPGKPLWIVTLANGSRCSYLPTADTYGKGIYQESIAVLEKGCLEQLELQITKALEDL